MERYFGINYEFSKEKIYETIDQTIDSGGKGYVCAIDGNVLTETHHDPAYLDVINHSLFAISDSSWVPLFIRWIYGVKVKPYQGPQMFLDIVKMKKYRMFFLGTNNTILNALKQNLIKYDERIANMQFRELPFCAVKDFDYASIAEEINHDHPDIIWVALGAPKQEWFMRHLEPHLQRGLMMAVGAAFKFHSGLEGQQRAPQWLVKMHLEFIYRLMKEPGKQGSRLRKYISSLPSILWEEMKLKKLRQKQGKGLTLMMRRFLELVRCGASGEPVNTDLFQGNVPWKTLLHAAERQMLAGVAFEAVKSLPTEVAPPKDLLIHWLMISEQIRKMNDLMDARASEAEKFFLEQGFSSCILKGQGLARLYAKPSARTPGDIDIWVQGDRKRLTQLAKEHDATVQPTYHHIDFHLFDDTEMELHYTPTWMYSPFGNRRLQRFLQQEARWDVEVKGGGFHVPSERLNLVFVLLHIYRHFFTEGVGLRQLLDYVFVLRACHSAEERQYVMAVLKKLGMKRFTGATMWVLGKCFKLEGEYMLCPPDEAEGRFLLIEVMKAGNFGQYDKRIQHQENESEWHTFMRKSQRNFHFLTRYPSEVLWGPLWKLWHWGWRKFK